MTKLDPKKSKLGKLNLASKALHPRFEEMLAEVAEMSIEKGYEPLNWLDPQNEVTVLKLVSAAKRHEKKFLKGININDEEVTLDGYFCTFKPSHLACAAYSLLMAAVLVEEGIKELDDRVLPRPKRSMDGHTSPFMKNFSMRTPDGQCEVISTAENIEKKKELDEKMKVVFREARIKYQEMIEKIKSGLEDSVKGKVKYRGSFKQFSYAIEKGLQKLEEFKFKSKHEDRKPDLDDSNCKDIQEHIKDMHEKNSQYFYGKDNNNNDENSK